MTDWGAIAGQFGRSVGDLPLHEQALAFIGRLPEAETLVVACSGGADSVYLSLAFSGGVHADHLSPLAGHPLVLAHFHHGVRGGEADGDMAFVRQMAGGLGHEVRTGRADPTVGLGEAELRKARYAWLGEICRELGASTLCLGHHADDVLETQLMALCTGSGPAGLASPLPVKLHADGLTRLRPLLGISRREIESALVASGAPWRTDSTNRDRTYTRNRVRLEAIPVLEASLPQEIRSGSRRTRRLMEEMTEALDHFLNRSGFDCTHAEGLRVAPLAGFPAAVVRRGLMAWWMRHFADIRMEKGTVDDAVRALCLGKRQFRLSMGTDRELVLTDGVLRVDTAGAEPTWTGSVCWACLAGPLFLPGGTMLRGQRVEAPQAREFGTADPAREAWIAVEDPVLEVRLWRAGDRYRPLGAPGRRKLQDLLTDRKVKAEQKRRLPVLINGQGEIIWVAGLPPADRFRLRSDSKTALKLTYHPEPSPLEFP